jgi:hypothetical protein
MTGTMHWDSRRMVDILQQSLYERRHPKVTNEDPAKEFAAKLETVENLWRDRNPTWPWASPGQWEKFVALRKVSPRPRHNPIHEKANRLHEWDAECRKEQPGGGCGCSTGCKTKTCGCRKAGRICGLACHLNVKPAGPAVACQNT